MKRRILITNNASQGEIDWLAYAIGVRILALVSAYQGTPAKFGKRKPDLSKFNPVNPRDRRVR